MRVLSTPFRNSLQDPASDEILIIFAKITHINLAQPILLVNDVVDYVWKGETYIGFPFEISLVSDSDKMPTASIRIQNVNGQIGLAALKLVSSPRINIDVVSTKGFGPIIDGVRSEVSQGNNSQRTRIYLPFEGDQGEESIQDKAAGQSSKHWWSSSFTFPVPYIDRNITQTLPFGRSAGRFVKSFISTPDSVDFTIGTNPFACDLWFASEAAGGQFSQICGQRNSAGEATSTSFRIERDNANKILGSVGVGASEASILGTSTFGAAINTALTHCALTWDTTTLRLFLNGVLEASTATAGPIRDSPTAMSVGRVGEWGDSTHYWTGLIKAFRLTIGDPVWTANFIPPGQEYSGPTPEYSAPSMRLRNVRGDAMAVEAELWSFDLSREPYPKLRTTKSDAPGLYR